MVRIAIVAVLGLVIACGSKQTPAESRSDGEDAAPIAVSEQAPDAGAKTVEPGPADAPLTAAECDDFVDHVVAIAARMRAENAKGKNNDTPESIEATQIKLRSELREECLRVSRSLFECALEAQDAQALAACQSAPN